jgi:predicted kinase
MYVDDHPMALNLDVDEVRRMLGGWLGAPEEAGQAARRMALEMARCHLLNGHDVVVPQYLGRLPFLQQLEDLAADVGARFVEGVMMDSKENMLRRFVQRSEASVVPAHLDAQALLDRSGGLHELAQMYDRLLEIVAGRPAARIIQAEEGTLELAYATLLCYVDEVDRR